MLFSMPVIMEPTVFHRAQKIPRRSRPGRIYDSATRARSEVNQSESEMKLRAKIGDRLEVKSADEITCETILSSLFMLSTSKS